MRPLQEKIIHKLGVKPKIDPEQEIRVSIDFIKNYLYKNAFLNTLVLGISGGQDSTLAGRLAQLAIEEMRDETGNSAYQFIAVRLPYGKQADEADAMKAIEFIHPDQVYRTDIKDSVDAVVKSVEMNKLKINDFNKGNIKARIRMVMQYAIAGEQNGVVIGTDHAAEAVVGFYTKYGDGAADIAPLYRLNKRQGKQLLKALKAPKFLYEKTPTADLEEEQPALPDEEALGLTYQEIDDYLEGKPIEVKQAEKLEALYQKTEHKRHLTINVFDDFWK
ncbi:MAG: ammonia-dependent NAD(+) synthetase [Firmicutes bacterium]|uniref:NH(3)-dependent NAD(+) synthetase n=1 Tax=Candidatus Gallilactobacillus intestinavium TaxID=2840838 RepID=A0A9D9H5Q0_9LACO|nr:ammonia-dependent NAD(+) synthetase [Candidatus Gallilactobacillus intestinavium]